MDNNMGGAEMAPPQKKKNSALIIGIIVGAVALAAIIVVLVLFVFTPGSGGSSDVRDPQPLFYMEDDDVFMAVGAQVVELEDAAIIDSGYADYINGMTSFDRAYVYYLADVDEETGAGKLMVINTNGDMEPQMVAKDVCEATISENGEYFLYLTDIEEATGDLYYGSLRNEAEKVSGDVALGQFALSPTGKNFYYIKLDAEDEDVSFALYAALNGDEPIKVDDGEGGKGDVISSVFVTDNGELAYKFEKMDEDTYEYDSTLYVFADGDRDKIATDANIEKVFGGPNDILYSEERTLYYKAPGEDKERISQDFEWAMFPPYYGSDANYEYDKHFVLIESDEDDNDQVTLYEMTIGEQPVKITKADSWGYHVNADFTWISFERDGETYLCYKDKGGWSDRIQVCESALYSRFDMAGKYFYYIESYDDDDDYGDLYRYQLSSKTEEAELLQYDVSGFELMNDVAYTLTTDDEVYRVESKDDKEMLFDEEIEGAAPAPDGLYVYIEAKEYDIFYLPTGGGDDETICLDAQDIVYLDGIISYNYTSPISDELAATMREVYEDAEYYMDIINDTNNSSLYDSHRYYEDTLIMLEDMLDDDEIGNKAMAMIDDFYWGFYYIDVYADAAQGSADKQQATDDLNDYFADAFEKFDKLIGADDGTDEMMVDDAAADDTAADTVEEPAD